MAPPARTAETFAPLAITPQTGKEAQSTEILCPGQSENCENQRKNLEHSLLEVFIFFFKNT